MLYEYATGDIFLTRNDNAFYANDIPGFWNHAAILCENYVIEAQMEPGGIIATPFQAFWDRYPEIIVLRGGNSSKLVGFAAIKYIGTKYDAIASFFSWWKRRNLMNCVSLLRRSYFDVTNFDPQWRFPDNIEQSKLYWRVYHKKEYGTWIKPQDFFKGSTLEIPEELKPYENKDI